MKKIIYKKVLTKQKAWCIVCLVNEELFAKHELYAMKGAKTLIHRGYLQFNN